MNFKLYNECYNWYEWQCSQCQSIIYTNNMRVPICCNEECKYNPLYYSVEEEVEEYK